ncbi:hypothetical protein L1049_001684 [Liquidambar formosana]|uniref:Uncharacterized protein n=1 Tax=Liquidambar formosana TaxID=63359 RepID=A0AAP0N6L1_LIQFO
MNDEEKMHPNLRSRENFEGTLGIQTLEAAKQLLTDPTKSQTNRITKLPHDLSLEIVLMTAFGWAYVNNWHNTWEQFYVYWICPFIGAILAAWVFRVLFPPATKQKKA